MEENGKTCSKKESDSDTRKVEKNGKTCSTTESDSDTEVKQRKMEQNGETSSKTESQKKYSILWFRHGLRLHDNPSLHEAIVSSEKIKLLPIFIFDGETAGTSLCGYNRMSYLLECLNELNERFKGIGSRLHIFKGKPVEIFCQLKTKYNIGKVCFEQDCEPIWYKRDEAVKNWCRKNDIDCVESVGHTLWNPHEIIELNGGTPPVTFAMFNHVVSSIGLPPKPLPDVDLSALDVANLEPFPEAGLLEQFPKCEDVGVTKTHETKKVYIGGETHALEHLQKRLNVELTAFVSNSFLPNRRNPELLRPPKSLSPDLRFGSLSIRKFYWGLMDAFKKSQAGTKKPFNPQIVVQLLWREFFYTMSVNNQYFGEMDQNKICINIDWYPITDNNNFSAFTQAQTGYPLIDAGVRQLLKEGWVHHIIRNALACFLTRGDLWISWEEGLRFFLENLLDADWSVCAGNWMWVSSSAFEDVLSCTTCIDPGTFGRRADPWGDYVRAYIPELKDYPVEYIYEPWTAPKDVQEKAGCIIGKDYPKRIVIHEEASMKNAKRMNMIKDQLLKELHQVPHHIKPSNEKEARELMIFNESCAAH